MAAREDEKVSVAMIVRDESAHLPECLAGLAGWANEICVVDTGSVDDTAALAREAGCRVGHFEWCNDFSAARNASLDLCKGDWIFVLDADERLAPADLPRIRGLMTAGRAYCYRFTTRNYTDAAHLSDFVPCGPGDSRALLPSAAGDREGFAGWYPSTKVRLFPNHPAARFEGAVHELVNVSLARAGIGIRTSEVPIHHYPLTKSVESVRRKQAMYIDLGRAKVEAHPEDACAHAELGDQFAEIGEYAAAVASYREAVRLNPGNARWVKDLGCVLYLMGRPGEAEQALRLSVRLDPALADGWRNLAVLHGDRGDWDGAAACLSKSVALEPDSAGHHQQLALALEAAGQAERAAKEAEEALRRAPRRGPALELYVRVMRGMGRAGDARAFLGELAAGGGIGLLEALDSE